MADIKALENSSYWEFCTILNNYLNKVEQHNEAIEKMRRENNLGSGRVGKKVKSGRK